MQQDLYLCAISPVLLLCGLLAWIHAPETFLTLPSAVAEGARQDTLPVMRSCYASQLVPEVKPSIKLSVRVQKLKVLFSFHSVTVLKCSDQKQLCGRKVFIWVTLSAHAPSLRDIRTETQDRNLGESCSLPHSLAGSHPLA